MKRLHTRRLLVVGVIVTAVAGIGAAIGLASHPGNPGPPAHQAAPINANVHYWSDNYGVGTTTPTFDPSLPDVLPLPNPLRPEPLCTWVFDGQDNLRGGDVLNDPEAGHPGEEDPNIAIWADANLDYADFTVLDISGSENFIDGRTVSVSDLKINGQKNQFLHGVEHGDGIGGLPGTGDPAKFDLSGSENCFLPSPVAIDNSGEGFPQSFVADHFNILGEGSAVTQTMLDAEEYFYCGSKMGKAKGLGANKNLAPIDAFCDKGNGTFNASVQEGELPDGLYFVEGDITLSASNLSANVTFVTQQGTLDASGSVNAEFRAYVPGLLFMTEFGTKNSKDNGEGALTVGGSTSTFIDGHIFAPNGRVELSGSRNYISCTVMGDRVSLNGSNLVIIGKLCGVHRVICSGDIVSHSDEHLSLGFTVTGEFKLLGVAGICKRYSVVADADNPSLLDPEPTITFTPFPNDDGGAKERFAGKLTFDPQPSIGGGFFMGLTYSPNNDEFTQPLLACEKPEIGADGFVVSADLPTGESWCLAGGIFIANSGGTGYIPTAYIYGEEDPRFGFK